MPILLLDVHVMSSTWYCEYVELLELELNICTHHTNDAPSYWSAIFL